jgi:hypothetical protein
MVDNTKQRGSKSIATGFLDALPGGDVLRKLFIIGTQQQPQQICSAIHFILDQWRSNRSPKSTKSEIGRIETGHGSTLDERVITSRHRYKLKATAQLHKYESSVTPATRIDSKCKENEKQGNTLILPTIATSD